MRRELPSSWEPTRLRVEHCLSVTRLDRSETSRRRRAHWLTEIKEPPTAVRNGVVIAEGAQ